MKRLIVAQLRRSCKGYRFFQTTTNLTTRSFDIPDGFRRCTHHNVHASSFAILRRLVHIDSLSRDGNHHRSNNGDFDNVDSDVAEQPSPTSIRQANRPIKALPPPDSSRSRFTPLTCRYVDKTRLLAQLLMSGKDAVYATAPRRMGKSLTVDMLGAIARGERDTFEGMDIVKDGLYDFEPYSVVQLDCSGLYDPGMTPKDVNVALADHICEVALDDHQIDGIGDDFSASKSIKALIRALRRQHPDRKIVVTIDEYDAPVNDFLSEGDVDNAELMAKTLKPFYTMLKARKADLRFVFATGICKFSLTSMFSGPNQMTPIMERTAEYCNLFGFTREQVKQTYGDYMIERGYTTKDMLDDTMDELVKHYNGYRFHPDQTDDDRSINPFSIVNFLASGKVENYWCHSAAASSFVPMLGVHSFDILAGFSSTKSELFSNVSAKEIASHWKQMAFFSGYATILSAEAFADDGESNYRLELGSPNGEVTKWFKRDAVASLIGDMYADGVELINKYGAALQSLDWDKAFGEYGQTLVNPRRKFHTIANEHQMNGVLASLLRLPGAAVESRFDGVYTELQYPLEGEAPQRAKRPDAVLLFSRDDVKHLIILEFKFCGNVDEAAQQIRDKQYAARALKWLSDTHQVVIDSDNVHCCGVNMKRLEDGGFELEWQSV